MLFDHRFQLLGGVEGDHAARGDGDLLPGLGVAPRPLGLVAKLEITEAGKLDAVAVLERGANLAAGTSWLWVSDVMAGAVDVLFVDEAGQMSLAHVLAASGAARNLILLGDPQQLEQPQKASHPEGADVAAL